jgi:hypothetical protein
VKQETGVAIAGQPDMRKRVLFLALPRTEGWFFTLSSRRI